MPSQAAFVRAGALGDVLLGLPALSALRRRHPELKVIVVAPMPQAQLALWGGVAQEVSDFGSDALAPLFAGGPLPSFLAGVDIAVVWLRSADEVVGAFRAGGTRTCIASPPFPPAGRSEHVAEWLAKTLQPLGVTLDSGWDDAPWLEVPQEGRARTRQWKSTVLGTRGYVVLHAGSGSARKNWPVEHWAAVAGHVLEQPHLGLIVLCGPADDGISRQLAVVLDSRDMRGRVALASGLDLEVLAGLLAGADLFLGNDSGVTHLAAAVGAPVVGVFGPTDPHVWRPRGPRVRVLGGAPASGRDGIFAAAPRWPALHEVLAAAQSWLAS
ncbi:MAG TPA: glycosyltransferase family 9 protein [Chloroflexota bacterium]|nr:glycosyltransferase family 9 protein [Chloroflexota bacterium]